MDFIREWVVAIASVTIIIATISSICPKNSAGRIVFLCGSILLSFVLISPFKGLDAPALARYNAEMEKQITRRTEALERLNFETEKNIVEENLRAYILHKTEEIGIDCDVRILCEGNLPYKANVICADEERLKIVADIIETELGIPLYRQSLRIEGI